MIDHLQYFIKTEFLPWNDSSVCAESNGASFMKKYRSQVELRPFLCSWVDAFVFRKYAFLTKFSIKLYVSEQILLLITNVYMLQSHKHCMYINMKPKFPED